METLLRDARYGLRMLLRRPDSNRLKVQGSEFVVQIRNSKFWLRNLEP